MFDEDGKFTPAHRQQIAKRMDQTIRLAKLTKSAVAERMGVSRAAVTQYCQTGEIALDRLAKFCQVTKASMDYIVTGSAPDMEAALLPMVSDLVERWKNAAAPAKVSPAHVYGVVARAFQEAGKKWPSREYERVCAEEYEKARLSGRVPKVDEVSV